MTRYRRDVSWRQPGDGRVVLAGSPLRMFRVSAGGAHVLSASLSGEQPDTAVVAQLLDRFVDAGALHPEYDGALFTVADVTVVMPTFGPAPTPADGVRTIVVDDGSPTPIHMAPPTTVVRLDVNSGPAAARNAGLAAVVTPLVAFLDSDVVVDGDWLTPLLAHFTDERVALVAPRVASAMGEGPTAHYEQRHSPLDLGSEPARVLPGSRVSYVPSAALVCRTDVLRELGGFDDTMRVGEDVDLVWRAVAAGHRVRYEPVSVVHHQPRPTWQALLRQRFGYGRSAAPLAAKHPGALAPVRMSGWSAGVWALVACRRPSWAALLAAGTTVALVRKLRDVPADESVRLAMYGHLAAGRQLAKGITRAWWPLAAAVAVFVPRSRRALLLAALAPSALDAIERRDAGRLLDTPTLLADEMAYGAGVWCGVFQHREPGPLTPEFRNWPTRGER